MHRFLLKVRNRSLRPLLRVYLRPSASVELVRLGTDYGGWWVPTAFLESGNVAYCAGAGEDISFDLALLDYGLSVTTFDPTPKAIAHVNAVRPVNAHYRFVPVGWWNKTDVLRFYSPSNPSETSHSLVNLQRTKTFFEAPVRRVAELMAELEDERIDLIKMDIEGAEHAVITDLLAHGPRPSVLCVEFDQPTPMRTVLATIRKLRESDYHLLKIEKWNYSFQHSAKES